MRPQYMSRDWLERQTGVLTWSAEDQERLRRLYLSGQATIARRFERGEIAKEYLRLWPSDPRD